MVPTFSKLAKKYATSDSVIIADVDCTAGDNQRLCQQNGVKGYPTLKYFIQGKRKDYNGGRDFDALDRHIQKEMGPPPPPCDVKKLKKTCSRREIKFIQGFDDMDAVEEELGKLQEQKKAKEAGGKSKWLGKAWLLKRIELLGKVKKYPAVLSQEKMEL